MYKYNLMDTKLTLKLDEKIINRAKRFVANRNISLSAFIENYLDSVTKDEDPDEIEISPFVKSMTSGNKSLPNTNWKEIREDYHNYLEEKYR